MGWHSKEKEGGKKSPLDSAIHSQPEAVSHPANMISGQSSSSNAALFNQAKREDEAPHEGVANDSSASVESAGPPEVIDMANIHDGDNMSAVPSSGAPSIAGSRPGKVNVGRLPNISFAPNSRESSNGSDFMANSDSNDGLQSTASRSFGRSFAASIMFNELDEENSNLQQFSSRDVHKLKQTLHDINFEDLDKTVPWTHQMEQDAISIRSGTYGQHEGELYGFGQEELPLNNSELALLRRNLRKAGRGELFGANEDDETMPFKWDEEGRPVPLTEFEKGPTGKVLRKIHRQLANPSTKLSEDSFSFLISAHIYSSPFMFAAIIFIIKGALFILICINLIDLTDDDNPLGTPAGISIPVAIAQFLALFIAVASQDDLRTALNYFYEGYEERHLGSAFVGSNYWKWLIAVWLQFLEGALGLATTFLLIVESDDVVGLMLDFTAVEFITLLDNAFFVLAKQGFMGPKNRLESEIIVHTEYSIPVGRIKTPARQIGTLLGTFIFLLIGWIFIYTSQLQGHYTPQSIVIQFDDDLRPELGAYSGIYKLKMKSGSDIDRVSYRAVTGDGVIGYCYRSKFWTFSVDDDSDACDNFVAKSSRSTSFDITETGEEQWFATEDSSLQRYFPMENFVLEMICDRDRDCGGIDQGICESHACDCAEGFYGIRCDYVAEDACETIAVDERRDIFRSSREFQSSYTLLRDASGTIVQAYHHPIYVAESGTTTGLDMMMYIGVRWALSHSIDALPQLDEQSHTYAGLANYLSSPIDFRAYRDLKSLAFFTEPVIFNTPDDGDSPAGIQWFSTVETDLANTERLGTVDTIMLCAVCDNSTNAGNPCQNGNELWCGDDGKCDCQNGASGTLCQITPLANGHCDTFFNTAPYKYDGGDCCRATCTSSPPNTCGAIDDGNLDAVDVGFPYCEDPNVIPSCDASDICWAPISSHAHSVSPGLTVLTTLSANGRIYVSAVPELDIVEVFDQVDSSWVRRGTLHEGTPGSNFGKILAISTLPGQAVNRRYGRIPILLAIGSTGNGAAGVKIVNWEPNDAAWSTVGNELDICEEEDAPADCDLVALDIGRAGDIATLAVVRSDDLIFIYRTRLADTNSEWFLVFRWEGNENTTDNGFFSGVSLSGTTEILAVSRGENAYIRFLPSGVVSTQELDDAFTVSTVDYVNVTAEMHLRSVAYDAGHVETGQIQALQFSESGSALLLFASSKTQDEARSLGFRISVDIHNSIIPYLSEILVLATSPLSDEEIESGTSLVEFAADASAMAVRIVTSDGPRIRIAVFDVTSRSAAEGSIYQKRLLRNVSLSDDFNDTARGDFTLSYDGSIFTQVKEGATTAYGLAHRCPKGSSHYRLSLTLDDHPHAVSWSLQTYRSLGDIAVPDIIIRECDECYFDNDRFGRSVVAEDVCVHETYDPCLRILFDHHEGLQSGSGLAVFKNGAQVIHHESTSTDQFIFVLDPDRAAECEAPSSPACGADEVKIIIELRLDNYPNETTWELNAIGIEDTTLLSSFNFTEDQLEELNYTNDKLIPPPFVEVCAPKDLTYEFSLRDEYGDGLCCSYGKGDFTIFVNGTEAYSFQREERRFFVYTVEFDSSGNALPATVPVTFEMELLGELNNTFSIIFEVDYHGSDREKWNNYYYNYYLYFAEQDRFINETFYVSQGDFFDMNITIHNDAFVGQYTLYWGTEPNPNKVLVTGKIDSNTTARALISEDSILTNNTDSLILTVTETPVISSFVTSPPEAILPAMPSNFNSPILCDTDEVQIVIEVRLDNFPNETAWELSITGREDDTLLHSFNYTKDWIQGLNYTKDDSTPPPLVELCVAKDLIFLFSLRDDSGDGLCCEHGEGGYSIYVDGKAIYTLEKGRTFDEDRVFFDSDGEVLSLPMDPGAA